jgi:hypothetical protein
MPEEKMNAAEYLATQQQLLMLVSLVREIDVEGFLRSITSSEGRTMEITAMRRMLEMKKIALGAQAFKLSLPPESKQGG